MAVWRSDSYKRKQGCIHNSISRVRVSRGLNAKERCPLECRGYLSICLCIHPSVHLSLCPSLDPGPGSGVLSYSIFGNLRLNNLINIVLIRSKAVKTGQQLQKALSLLEFTVWRKNAIRTERRTERQRVGEHADLLFQCLYARFLFLQPATIFSLLDSAFKP